MIKTIANEFLTISVKSLGAELCSAVSADECEYIWQADLAVWGKHSPILFPVVGRMHNQGRYRFDDAEYTMPKHGFAASGEFKLVDARPDAIIFELTESDTTLACWPFRFALRVCYTLDKNTLRIGFEVCNTDDSTMFFSLGAHPAFACPLEKGLAFDDYHLRFETAETAVRWYLKDGLLGHCEQNFLDSTDSIAITAELFADDALIFKNLTSNTLTLASDKSRRAVKVDFAGWPDLGIWSKGTGFVCIEPWFGHDSPADFNGTLEKKPGIISLDPGRTFAADYSINFF
jgi:galactose mutarotase-like enzyme